MIGILKSEFGWQQIFEQEGLLYTLLNNIPEAYHYPIIINRELKSNEIEQIKTLLNNGLGIIIDFPNLKKIISDIKFKSKKINYILNDGGDIFNNIIAIDLALNGYESRPIIFETDYGKGYIIAIPFDINQAMLDTRNERKPFYYPSRKYPNEIVAKVSKGEVRKLVVNCIRKLYQKMNLIYCHIWYYPKEFQSAFAFRVDTDFGPENILKATFDVEEKTNNKFIYFVNTTQHPTLANKKRDFQIHCYEHNVFKDYQTNYINIKKAKAILEKSNITPIGFVSPYGFWNENLQKAIEDNGIRYSSEFSLAYDDLPFFPIIENRKSNVLQIPVHPICIGRLIHAGLSPNSRIDYYKKYFERQLQANELIFIYDHPHRIAQFPDIFYDILSQANKLPSVWITNMTEFFHWWQTRFEMLINSRWQISQGRVQIKTSNQDSKIFLHIVTPNQTEAFLPLKQGIYNMKDLSYKNIVKTEMDKNEIENYLRLKSKTVRLQIQFYETIDKILDFFKGE